MSCTICVLVTVCGTMTVCGIVTGLCVTTGLGSMVFWSKTVRGTWFQIVCGRMDGQGGETQRGDGA